MENVIRFGTNFIELSFYPSWDYVKSLWDFIKRLLNIMIRDPKVSDMISLACIELAENAVKYTDMNNHQKHRIDFRLKINRNNQSVNITISNFSSKENIEILKTEIKRLSEFQKKEQTEALFLAKLAEASEQNTLHSRLGLIRIVHESKGKIKYEFDGNRVIAKVLFQY